MRVAVMCGGKGTRLGEPVKCLTEVAGRPFMDWKLEQLERCGATEITLVVGPFADAFAHYRLPMISDAQTGIRDALRAAEVTGWWTMGDVLLELAIPDHLRAPAAFVVPGEQLGGLWLDCGLYRGRGPWQMYETTAKPWTINTPQDREGTDAHLLRQCLTR